MKLVLHHYGFGVIVENAHPHTDINQTFFVIHNGIIENFQELKNQLVSC
jgi:glucosamine 6-phosphate synthetase-like amidotransferase/phosphosugar isomerase protein